MLLLPELPAGCQMIMMQRCNVGVKEREQLVLETAERFVSVTDSASYC